MLSHKLCFKLCNEKYKTQGMEKEMAREMPGDNNSPGGQAGWLHEGLLVTASSDLAVRY